MTDYITKEQFGVALFDAIFTIGQILGEEQKARMSAAKGQEYARKSACQAAQGLRGVLATQMDALSDAEAANIVRRYPWVLQ